jgi:hypothetical protein
VRKNEHSHSGRPENEVENDRKHLLWPPEDGLWFIYPLEGPDVYACVYLCATDEPNAHGSIFTRISRPRNKTLDFDRLDPQVRVLRGLRMNCKGAHESQLQWVWVEVPYSVMKGEMLEKLARAQEGASLFENEDDIRYDYGRWKIVSTMGDALSEIQSICERSGNVSQFFPYGDNQCLPMHHNTNSLQLFSLIGGEGYKSSVRHYLESSCEIARAAVQPGRVEDLSMIVSFFVQHSPKYRLDSFYNVTADEGSGEDQSSVCRGSSAPPILLHTSY